MADYVLVEKAEGVAILTMNRPEQLNALNHQLSSELHDAVTRMSTDDEVGCIVITGAGLDPDPPAFHPRRTLRRPGSWPSVAP